MPGVRGFWSGDFAGVPGDELTTKGWGEWLHPDDQRSATEKWKQSLAKGTAFESEYRLRRGCDGAYRWFLCRAVAVLDQAGVPVRWFGSCTDIDDQKQIERDREAALAAERQARTDLLRSARVKDEFLATLSHELRTPMTAILGWARLLRDPAMREKNFERGIEAIDSSAKAQARLIDDLLDMNRILSGKLMIKPEPTDLRAVVQAAATAILPAANNRKIALALDLDGPDAGTAPITLNGDPARLQQVVWNLLTNAVIQNPKSPFDKAGDPVLFHKAGQFPTAEDPEYELSQHARHVYKSGELPFLLRTLAPLNERLHLPFALLSDAALELTQALALPTMQVAGQTLIRRLALVIRDGRIAKVLYPVFPPDRNAADVLAWLQENRA